VLLALEIKKIPYDSRLLEFSKQQNKTPEFLALNPRGKVPVIKDGDFVLSESLAILAYLDRKTPLPPLFGRTPEETGRIWKSVSESVLYLEPPAIDVVGPIYFGKAEEKAEQVRSAIAPLRDELAHLEAALKGRAWLAGDTISAADIVAYPTVENVLRAAGKDAARRFELGVLPFPKSYPALAAWRDRITALPGYERTYPPHWRAAPVAAA
jgi:glutathione S-transferase